MAKWRFTAPDGTKYDVEGDNPQTAYKALQERIKSDAKEEFGNLPLWQKPIQAADDVARIASNLVTAGYRDKLAGYLGGGTPPEEKFKTEKARARAGTAALGAEMLPMMMVPSSAGAGFGTAMLEGGIFGGLQAGAHDEPLVPGVLGGAAAGGLVGAGSALNTGLRKAPKAAARRAAQELGTLRLKDGLYLGGGAGALSGIATGGVTPGSLATGAATAVGVPVMGALARTAARALKDKARTVKPETVEHWDPEIRRLLSMLGIGATQQDE